MAVEDTYNLVTLLLNELDTPIDIKLIAGLGEAGTTDRWKIRPGINYASLNLRPTAEAGPADVHLRIYAGDDLPGQCSPPESQIQAEATFPAQVLRWGKLRIRTLEDGRPQVARVYVRASDGLSYAPSGDSGGPTLSRITWDARLLLFLQPRRALAPLARGPRHDRGGARHRIRDHPPAG